MFEAREFNKDAWCCIASNLHWEKGGGGGGEGFMLCFAQLSFFISLSYPLYIKSPLIFVENKIFNHRNP